MAKGVSGVGVTAAAIGGIFLWSAVKGASITDTVRDLISGKQPSGQNINPIAGQVADALANPMQTGQGKYATQILQGCAKHKGTPYCFGGGHSRNPCASRCKDCSGTISCIFNEIGILSGSLTTAGFAKFGSSVNYTQRSPGDLIIWNGGPGGGHMGIIVTASGNGGTMWNNQCAICGGFKITKYPYGSRSSQSAIIRRP